MIDPTSPLTRGRGFTLVELMIVVAIIGILASVAIPGFSRLLYRAKAAERTEVMARIKRSVQDLYVQQGSIPGGALVGNYQPPFPPSQLSRMPNWTVPGWDDVFKSGGIDGALYYSYMFTAVESVGGAPPELTIIAAGDLDGDGVTSWRWVRWERRNGIYYTDETDMTGTWLWPPLGQEDLLTF